MRPEGAIKDDEGSEFLQDFSALTEAEMIALHVLDGSRLDTDTTIEVIDSERLGMQSFIERKHCKT